MSLPENFCSAPFIQLQTSKDNRYGPCPYTVNHWQVEGNIADKWKSKELESLRKSFLENKQDPQCKRCWKEEEAGKKSLRLRLSEHKGSKNTKKIFEKYIETKKYLEYPRVLTLIPGNECNLACPSCSGGFSSKWNSLIENGKYEIQSMEPNWNLSDADYQDIVDNSEKLQKIELFGGEPFLNKRNRKLLIDKLIEKGTSKNITIYFNTNGTLFDEKYMTLILNNFKFVEIRLSIDGLYEQFEYLRYGANFEKVCENAEKFNSLPNADFEIICTISIFNLFSIADMDKFFKERNWSVYYNIASFPSHLLLHNLPESTKDHVDVEPAFYDIKKYTTMKQCNQSDWEKFVRYTKELDNNRGLSFKNTFPTLYNLVKKHGYE